MNKLINRRNLSGIFIFNKFPGENKRKPTVFEDCPDDVQNKWLDSLDIDALKNLSRMLGKCLRDIGDQFDLMQ